MRRKNGNLEVKWKNDLTKMSFTKEMINETKAKKLKSREMKEGMKDDEGWWRIMKDDEGWMKKDEGWWFQAAERFCRQTDRRTFVIVESLLQPKNTNKKVP